MKGLNFFHLNLVDEFMQPIPDDELVSITVFTNNTLTAATIYEDEAGDSAKTNPVTTIAYQGTRFYGGNATYDVAVISSKYGAAYATGIRATSPRIKLCRQVDTTNIKGTAGTNVTAREFLLPGGLMLLELDLAAVPLDLTAADTTAISYASSLIYTAATGIFTKFAAGAQLSLSMPTSQSTYFVDATPEGDIGVGSTAFDASEALGTTTTDDDIVNAKAYTMAAYAASNVVGGCEGAEVFNGSSTAHKQYLNGSVDAYELGTVDPRLLVTGRIWELCLLRPAA